MIWRLQPQRRAELGAAARALALKRTWQRVRTTSFATRVPAVRPSTPAAGLDRELASAVGCTSRRWDRESAGVGHRSTDADVSRRCACSCPGFGAPAVPLSPRASGRDGRSSTFPDSERSGGSIRLLPSLDLRELAAVRLAALARRALDGRSAGDQCRGRTAGPGRSAAPDLAGGSLALASRYRRSLHDFAGQLVRGELSVAARSGRDRRHLSWPRCGVRRRPLGARARSLTRDESRPPTRHPGDRRRLQHRYAGHEPPLPTGRGACSARVTASSNWKEGTCGCCLIGGGSRESLPASEPIVACRFRSKQGFDGHGPVCPAPVPEPGTGTCPPGR